MTGSLPVQLHRATQKVIGRQPAQDQVGVGDGGKGGPTIAGGPRVCAGAGGADTQRPTRIDGRNRAAARADRVDVENGDAQGVAPHHRLGGGAQLSVAKRDIGGCAAHVKGDDLVKFGLTCDCLCADHTTGRAGEDAADRAATRLGRANAPAVRLHDAQVVPLQRPLQPGQVAVHDRGDVSVDRRRAGALVFAVFWQHL